MILLASAAALAAALQPAGPATLTSACAPSAQQASYQDGAPGVRRLGQLPRAELMRAVNRQANGCALLEVKTRGESWILRGAGRASAAPARSRPH